MLSYSQVNNYTQQSLKVTDNISLPMSIFSFKKGSLIGTENERIIMKPDAYYHWKIKRKETFLAGRLAIRHAQAYLNMPLLEIPKALDHSPVWPKEYTGSVSHTDDQAIAILLPHFQNKIKGIGIDIEKTANANLLQDYDLIGKNNEYQLLTKLESKASLAALLLFSLKESIYKALYPIVGRFFDFLDVQLIHIQENRITFKVIRNLSIQVQEGFIIYANFSWRNNCILTWSYHQ